ncbi:MAG: gluconokinase [Acidobacteriaceae bacterium]
MIILVMGVAGAGKTTVGALLAEKLGWKFADADSYHSSENIKKMAAGVPLTDADREPWLRILRDAITSWIANRENVVLACSALKKSYRKFLLVGPEVKCVFLSGTFPLIEERLRHRSGHYAGPDLLESQFHTLEEPAEGIKVDVSAPPADIVWEIRQKLAL